RSRRIRQTAPDATFTPVRSDPRNAPHHPLRDKSRSALQLNRAEFSRVFQAMRRPQRNINGLVFTKQFDITVNGDFCRSRDHYPVFRPVMMHLYRQAFARFHGDAFHLVAVARVDRVILHSPN
ncbi:hypothetical protein Q604_UNBC06904G0001, partial [human gut metagenome]